MAGVWGLREAPCMRGARTNADELLFTCHYLSALIDTKHHHAQVLKELKIEW